MTTLQLLTSTWDWQPTVLVGCAGLAALYLQVARPLSTRAALFMTGVLMLLLALVSPLDRLGDTYLFSAHMLQHFLLILVVPPLLLLGIPPHLFERLLRWAPAARAERVLGQPALAWLIGVATLWVWHAPALYDAALGSEGIHVMQHLCFLVASTVFWWPVVAPLSQRRMNALAIGAYLILGSMANSLLGVVVTFAPAGLYPAYAHPYDTLGILPLVRQGWDLSYAADQQLGGLLMWVGSTPIFVAACLYVIIRWYHEPEQEVEDLPIAEDVASVIAEDFASVLDGDPDVDGAQGLAAARAGAAAGDVE